MERLDLNTLDALVAEQERLQVEADEAQLVLEGLEADLRGIDREMLALEEQQPQYEALGKVCGSLEELDKAGGLELFWESDDEDPRARVDRARRKIDQYGETMLTKAVQRQDAAERVIDQERLLDALH